MRWIILSPLFLLITSCIIAEGTIIEEPEDVVVSPKMYQFTPDYPCQSMDVTKPKQIVQASRV